jgi:hypothetical protein
MSTRAAIGTRNGTRPPALTASLRGEHLDLTSRSSASGCATMQRLQALKPPAPVPVRAAE